MHATDIIAYAWNADNWCPDCVEDVPESDNTEEGKAPIFADQMSDYEDENGLYCRGCGEEIVARKVEPLVFEWEDVHGKTMHSMKRGETFLDGGFRLVVEIDYDHDYDFTDGRGRWIDAPEDPFYPQAALKNPRAKYDRGVFKYFMPDQTVSNRLHEYVKLGYSLRDARKRAVKEAREDMQIAADPESAGYIAVSVVVHVLYLVSHSGFSAWVELGRDSLHGIELEASGDVEDDEYIKDTVKECAAQAITCAYGTIKVFKEVDTRPLEERI